MKTGAVLGRRLRDALSLSGIRTTRSEVPWIKIAESLDKFYRTFRGQTVYSVHCKRITQQAKIKFVAEFAILRLFFDLLCCFGFHKQMPKTLSRSKSLQN